MSKICTKCSVLKELEEFYFDNRLSNYVSRCKECRKKYNRDNAGKIRENNRRWRLRPEYRQRKAILSKESYWRNRALHMWTQARRNRRGLEFAIAKEDIVIPDNCPIFNISFDRDRFSPSLDRIDNTKGYIPGNIRVISKLANTMKNSATLQELKTFCESNLRLLEEDIVQTT